MVNYCYIDVHGDQLRLLCNTRSRIKDTFFFFFINVEDMLAHSLCFRNFTKTKRIYCAVYMCFCQNIFV